MPPFWCQLIELEHTCQLESSLWVLTGFKNVLGVGSKPMGYSISEIVSHLTTFLFIRSRGWRETLMTGITDHCTSFSHTSGLVPHISYALKITITYHRRQHTCRRRVLNDPDQRRQIGIVAENRDELKSFSRSMLEVPVAYPAGEFKVLSLFHGIRKQKTHHGALVSARYSASTGNVAN